MSYCDSPGRPSPGFPPYNDWLRDLYGPLRAFTTRRLKGFSTVARWDDPDDVLHSALLRLIPALDKVRPASSEHFSALACAEVRRECLDRARRYRRPTWQALHAPLHEWATARCEMPGESGDLLALHAALGKLSAEERELLRLLFWEGRSQDEVARLLQVSARTLQRRWTALLRQLHALLTSRMRC